MLLMDSLATGHKVALWRVPCKSWACPRCSKVKAQAIAHKARVNFVSDQVRFLTLTIRPQGSIPEAVMHINRAWNRLRLKITRKVGKVKYYKVIEPQPGTGMPHFHVLLDKYVSAAWLNSAVTQSGFGPIFKIKMVRNDQVFNYVTKYMAKGLTDDTFFDALLLLHSRRFSFSRGLAPWLRTPSFHPVSLHNQGAKPLLESLLFLRWLDISISSGYYPIKINNDIAYFFKRAPVPLLPAPPKSGSGSPPASTHTA